MPSAQLVLQAELLREDLSAELKAVLTRFEKKISKINAASSN